MYRRSKTSMKSCLNHFLIENVSEKELPVNKFIKNTSNHEIFVNWIHFLRLFPWLGVSRTLLQIFLQYLYGKVADWWKNYYVKCYCRRSTTEVLGMATNTIELSCIKSMFRILVAVFEGKWLGQSQYVG